MHKKIMEAVTLENLFLGTSGWSYKDWIGPFYQKASRKFSYYSRFFNTAEINSTFYRYPSRATIFGLNRTAPKKFVFCAKLPKLITHEKRLDPELMVKSDLLRFLELLEPLRTRQKLGCILIQLPPSFVYERDRHNFAAFLEMLPTGYEFAAEFRDHSWLRNTTWNLLKKHNVAYCIVDEPLLPPEIRITTNFAYFRWHGRGTRPWYNYRYSEAELKDWVPSIMKTREKVQKIYGYFNNHYHGYAVENCIEILEMFNISTSENIRVKEKIIRYNRQKRPTFYEKGLDDFGFTTSETTVGDLLLKITDKNRLERGRQIRDSTIKIRDVSKKRIEASVKTYFLLIDFGEKILQHNCDDWQKGLGMKRLCKHFVKLFFTLPPAKSIDILQNILQNRNEWSFKMKT